MSDINEAYEVLTNFLGNVLSDNYEIALLDLREGKTLHYSHSQRTKQRQNRGGSFNGPGSQNHKRRNLEKRPICLITAD